MSATYDATAIATDIISYARARFRDVGGLSGTTVTLPLLQDEEYQGFITRCGTQEGLAQAALSLAADFAQKVQRYSRAGGTSVDWPSRPKFYQDLALDLRTWGLTGQSGSGTAAFAPVTPSPCNDDRLQMLDGRLKIYPNRYGTVAPQLPWPPCE